MNDKEVAMRAWEWVQVRLAAPFEGIAQGKWTVRLPLLPFSQVGFDNEDAAWSAAAEFTRTRLEQVRQLREEIRFVCEADYSGSDGEVTEQAEAAQKRTVARLESTLATLTQGMKPDVQP